MKITEHIARAKGTLLSYEILPPLKGRDINSIYKHLDPLMEFKPSWVNVTYHRSETMFRKRSDGTFEKLQVRKRPGTVAICAALKYHYGVDTTPHIICGGFTKAETEDALIDLNFLGINNLLVLRGDAAKSDVTFAPEVGGHAHALELLEQISNLNKGIYLDYEDIASGYKMDFCMGIAGYPEKHFEAPNMESDMAFLKKKVEAGAQYIMTQMFFDNQKYFDFVKRCRDMGITVPIIPGLKPLTKRTQLQILPSIFHVDIPEALTGAVNAAKTDEAVEQVGIEWLTQQSNELKRAGVPVLHYYTLGKPSTFQKVLKNVF